MNYKKLLNKFPRLIVKENESLAKYTYTRTGGQAELLLLPTTIDEMVAITEWSNEEDYTLTVIGNGSNLIIRDGGIPGVTVILSKLNKVIATDYEVIAESGATIIEVSNKAAKHKLQGLEFACGIPGSVGGAVFMNAGAYGGEAKDVIKTVTILTREGEIKDVSNEDMKFSYRHSALMDSQDIVLKVTFSLKHGSFLKIRLKMSKLTYLRTSKQPLEYPSCGSVFKNSSHHYTGRLIKSEGLQGKRYGGAEISKKHPNFIVNIDNATSTDYIYLIEYVKSYMLEKFGYDFEVEPRIIGKERVD